MMYVIHFFVLYVEIKPLIYNSMKITKHNSTIEQISGA